MFICLKDAVKKYGEGEAAVYALNHADLVIGKGEICVILGPSGSGKSTMLNMLGGLDYAGCRRLDYRGKKSYRPDAKGTDLVQKRRGGICLSVYNLIPDLTG